jgi:Ca2+-binding RTX toxin-like protein
VEVMLTMTKVNLNGHIRKMPKKILIALSISLVVLSVSAGGLSAPNAWAGSYDFDDDNREVLSESVESEAFSNLPLHPEKRTITGNNDGNPIDGTRHDEIIIGTELADTIDGKDGSDVINGAVGADTIEGDDGDDTIQEADGSGQVYGQKGNDVIVGGFEPDYLSGGSGMDELYGIDDDDTLRGGSGADYFDCGFGFDTVVDFDSSEGDTHSTDCEVIIEK